MRNAEKSHKKRLQTYHDLIANKKKQDISLYNAHDWTNDFISRKRRDEPILPIVKSSDVKPKMIELDRKIGHKSVMSIHEFFVDRDEPYHLVYQEIYDMEGIREASAEGGNGMDQLFEADLLVDGSAAI